MCLLCASSQPCSFGSDYLLQHSQREREQRTERASTDVWSAGEIENIQRRKSDESDVNHCFSIRTIWRMRKIEMEKKNHRAIRTDWAEINLAFSEEDNVTTAEGCMFLLFC